MQENDLYKISLIVMAIGLIFLYFYADNVSLPVSESLEETAESVKIKGKITRISSHKDILFLTLEGEKTITTDVIVFTKEPIFLEEGNIVEVSGLVEEYKGKKEVIASSIVLK